MDKLSCYIYTERLGTIRQLGRVRNVETIHIIRDDLETIAGSCRKFTPLCRPLDTYTRIYTLSLSLSLSLSLALVSLAYFLKKKKRKFIWRSHPVVEFPSWNAWISFSFFLSSNLLRHRFAFAVALSVACQGSNFESLRVRPVELLDRWRRILGKERGFYSSFCSSELLESSAT